MSWSISLSGTKEAVAEELSAAGDIIRQAEYAVRNRDVGTAVVGCTEFPNVSVSVSGHVWSSDKGAGSGASYSVSQYAPVPPAAPAQEAEAIKEAAPNE